MESKTERLDDACGRGKLQGSAGRGRAEVWRGKHRRTKSSGVNGKAGSTMTRKKLRKAERAGDEQSVLASQPKPAIRPLRASVTVQCPA